MGEKLTGSLRHALIRADRRALDLGGGFVDGGAAERWRSVAILSYCLMALRLSGLRNCVLRRCRG